jgi:alkylation response protein AidB-like acyl-CoA dehydrogenase
MDLAFSPEDLAFRDEVRAFIDTAFDADMRARSAQSKTSAIGRDAQVRWFKRLAERGWLAPDWPVEYGGTGWGHSQKFIFDMEMALAGAPTTSNMGLRMCAPVIMAFGTPEQGSGSDLASLSMKAVRDGDDYVLNGSKIWTTYAQYADWMFCLVRTSSEAQKQRGISFLLLDMTSPGITVRSLPTLDGPKKGAQEVNQVFFEDVRVPVANRIGEEGQGWTYAKYLLQFERGGAYAPGLTHQLNTVKRYAQLERDGQDGAMIRDPDFRRKLAEMDIKVDTLNATELKIFANRAAGQAMGPVSSMLKLEGSQAQQAITELALEVVGPYATPFVEDTFAGLTGDRNDPRAGPDYAATVAPMYLNQRKTSIYAGSNEIQHNIMAKMILGI